MKIRKFNENVENKNKFLSQYYVLIERDHMGTFSADIFESKEELMSHFTSMFIFGLTRYYKEDTESLNETLIDLFAETNLKKLIEKVNDISDDLELELKYYYTISEIEKPIKSREQIIEEYRLKKDTNKYNI